MRIQKILLSLLAFAILLSCAGCGKPMYKDGVYHKEADEFHNGWKETVEITIVDGEIAKVNWDAIAQNEQIPIGKKQYSKSGLYGMLAAGAQDEWCDQAKKAEDYILLHGIDSVKLDGDGYTDTVSGCSIAVSGLVALAMQCLEEARIK